MKSDFMAAITQVCHERQLPLETVMEAVEVALVSAYKRNYGANKITAKVDPETGAIKIFVEKEVVDDLFDDKNEILLDEAKRIDPDAELGSVIQVENMPENFGRIAAQTTKQVILQRIREAERDALYNVYSEREGEIVNGTVHKIDSHQVILSLGKVEAVLPRSEQIPTERYTESQRLRAYVSEVIKTPRGPQIVVSRTHRNMLRRLLEVEVPEIYNGTVEIKAIAREAGYRSKVAVAALQEGVDPVGSCVGMRGVRIQSIVNELGGEKIDVAQWSPDTKVFIANALSPAKVLNVILQDIDSDKTAMVVVPDKQLSLAIGKEGQNARLAAKLTGWRIDIKSAVEAALEALSRASGSNEIKARVSDRPEVFSLASSILEERREGVEMSQGELQLLSEMIELVGQAALSVAREEREAEMAARAARMARMASEDVDLLAEAEAILAESASTDVVDEEAEIFDEYLLDTELADEEQEEDVEAVEAEADLDVVEAEETDDLLDLAAGMIGDEEEVEEAVILEEPDMEPVEAEVELEAEAEVEAEEQSEEPEVIPSILDSLVEKPTKEKKRLKPVFIEEEEDEEELEVSKRRTKSKGRTLEYDENLGQVISRRRRKPNRQRGDWTDLYDDE